MDPMDTSGDDEITFICKHNKVPFTTSLPMSAEVGQLRHVIAVNFSLDPVTMKLTGLVLPNRRAKVVNETKIGELLIKKTSVKVMVIGTKTDLIDTRSALETKSLEENEEEEDFNLIVEMQQDSIRELQDRFRTSGNRHLERKVAIQGDAFEHAVRKRNANLVHCYAVDNFAEELQRDIKILKGMPEDVIMSALRAAIVCNSTDVFFILHEFIRSVNPRAYHTGAEEGEFWGWDFLSMQEVLRVAATYGRLHMLQHFASCGVELRYFPMLITCAVKHGYLRELKYLLRVAHVDFPENKENLLEDALKSGFSRIADTLVFYGCPINERVALAAIDCVQNQRRRELSFKYVNLWIKTFQERPDYQMRRQLYSGDTDAELTAQLEILIDHAFTRNKLYMCRYLISKHLPNISMDFYSSILLKLLSMVPPSAEATVEYFATSTMPMALQYVVSDVLTNHIWSEQDRKVLLNTTQFMHTALTTENLTVVAHMLGHGFSFDVDELTDEQAQTLQTVLFLRSKHEMMVEAQRQLLCENNIIAVFPVEVQRVILAYVHGSDGRKVESHERAKDTFQNDYFR